MPKDNLAIESIITSLFAVGLIEIRSLDEVAFTYASGKKGHFYANLRELIAHRDIAEKITQQFGTVLGFDNEQYNIFGVATGSISLATHVTYHSPHLIGGYVDLKKKEHGKQQQIVGGADSVGLPTWVLEDVVNTGGSAIDAYRLLEQEPTAEGKKKYDMRGIACVMAYHTAYDDTFPPITPLFTVADVLSAGVKQERISAEDRAAIVNELSLT